MLVLQENERERISLTQNLKKCENELVSVNSVLVSERQQNAKLLSELNCRKEEVVNQLNVFFFNLQTFFRLKSYNKANHFLSMIT